MNCKYKKLVPLFLLITLTFFGCAEKKNGNLITVATCADFPPYEYIKDGNIEGLEIELIKTIAEKTGKKVEIKNMDFDGVLTSVATGKVDIAIAGISVTNERKKSMDFSKEIFSNEVHIVQKKTTNYETTDDLQNKKIGFQIGTTAEDFINDNIDNPESKGYKDYVQAITDLENGKIDAIIMDQIPAEKMIKEKPNYKISKTVLYSDMYSIATKKGANKELIDEINSELENLKKSGEYDKIVNKYFK